MKLLQKLIIYATCVFAGVLTKIHFEENGPLLEDNTAPECQTPDQIATLILLCPMLIAAAVITLTGRSKGRTRDPSTDHLP